MQFPWNKGSFIQAYNAQIAVDSASQVIVAAEVTQETNDKKLLLPMIAQIETNLEQKPEKVSADTGYFSTRKRPSAPPSSALPTSRTN